MKPVNRFIFCLVVSLAVSLLGACSDNDDTESDVGKSAPNGESQGNSVFVNQKTKQTIQDAKNMDALLQKSVDQQSRELDKY